MATNYHNMISENYGNEDGYLELILGPMFSGKTTRILEIYNHYSFIQKRVMVINYAEDKRYHETMLSTHDHKMIPCTLSVDLKLMWTNPNHKNYSEMHCADVILINEGQFFPELKSTVIDMVERCNKTVYICGLDGDFRRNKFGELLDLEPFCDNIIKLKSLCSTCRNGKRALFSHRITDEVDQVSIGSHNYVPLCRGCYKKANCP
uniref:thymidine kinase n=1 Tax=viral metagenome TaxID=1070528 RepID=A0A6C0B6P5_9ZZZZ